MDSDPHGLAILSTYVNGSAKFKEINHCLTVPRMKFLGVNILDYKTGWMESSQYDRHLARLMLQKAWIQQPEFLEWRRQLQLGLFLGKNAEMNVVGDPTTTSSPLAEYVKKKIFNEKLRTPIMCV